MYRRYKETQWTEKPPVKILVLARTLWEVWLRILNSKTTWKNYLLIFNLVEWRSFKQLWFKWCSALCSNVFKHNPLKDVLNSENEGKIEVSETILTLFWSIKNSPNTFFPPIFCSIFDVMLGRNGIIFILDPVSLF